MQLKEDEISLFKGLVESWSGIHLSHNDLRTLKKLVPTEMASIGAKSLSDYYTHLRSPEGREELDRLIGLVANNETYFFREPDCFSLLGEVLLPEIVGQKTREKKTVRILSAGCSTGEEPYSIAITLLERQDLQFDFEVLGVDIDRIALSAARKGVFKRNSFRGSMNTARMDAWFVPVGNESYELCDGIKEKVRFRYLNLNTDLSLEDTFGKMDVIFFRNVSIYLSPDAVSRINRNLANCLKEGGYLIVGSAEVPQHDFGRLSLRDINGVFLFQKAEPPRVKKDTVQTVPVSSEHRLGSPPSLVTPLARERDEFDGQERMERDVGSKGIQRPGGNIEAESLYQEALNDAMDERKKVAAEKLTKILDENPRHINAYCLMADICLDSGKFEEAAALCNKALEVDPWLAWPHIFLGLIFKYEGDCAKATKTFKTAIYLKPGSWLAHFHLGETYRTMGKIPLAVREYRNVLNAVKKEADGVEKSIVSMRLSPEYIVRACQANVQSLTEGK